MLIVRACAVLKSETSKTGLVKTRPAGPLAPAMLYLGTKETVWQSFVHTRTNTHYWPKENLSVTHACSGTETGIQLEVANSKQQISIS